LWQWEHKTGFRNYKEKEVERIEDAYQRGREHVRLKTGKTNAPMEIFFHDMIQHDPITGNSRRIRRVGREGFFRSSRRLGRRFFRLIVEGGLQRRDFQRYEQMKKEIHGGIGKRNYTVNQFYRKEGWIPRIARSNWFFAASMALVVFNASWICIDANRVQRVGNIPGHVTVMENLFCALFTVELLIRFLAFQRRRDCLKDAWFCFDLGLVTMMFIETWLIPLFILAFHNESDNSATTGDWVVLRVAQVLRLTRLGRIARLLHAVPEVYMLLKGIATAIRSVFVTLILLCVLLLLFGVIFRTQAADDAELASIFPSVGSSMWLLLLHGTFLDSPSTLLNEVGAISPTLASVLLAFIFLSSFTILNMLIGILCGVVSTVANNEKEQAAVQYLKSTLLDILECHDQDGDRSIQRDEFELLMRNPEVHITLTRFGVDVADLISLQDRLFEDKTAGMPWQDVVSDNEDEIMLKVSILGARGLRCADFGVVNSGMSDPYCLCEVPGKAGLQLRTQTVMNSLEPAWNHEGKLGPLTPTEPLRFTVLDEDWGKQDDFLGRVTLTPSDFLPGGLNSELALAGPKGDLGGYVRVKIEVLQWEGSRVPSLSFSEFLESVMRLRGGNSASVHDIVELRSLLLEQFAKLHTHFARADAQRTLSGGLQATLRREEACAEALWATPLPGTPSRSSGCTSVPVPGTLPDKAPVLTRLDVLDAGQRELRTEMRGLRAQLTELQHALQVHVGVPPNIVMKRMSE